MVSRGGDDVPRDIIRQEEWSLCGDAAYLRACWCSSPAPILLAQILSRDFQSVGTEHAETMLSSWKDVADVADPVWNIFVPPRATTDASEGVGMHPYGRLPNQNGGAEVLLLLGGINRRIIRASLSSNAMSMASILDIVSLERHLRTCMEIVTVQGTISPCLEPMGLMYLFHR
ncbi:hypothetical protein OE88DRAFT_336131 [Heliocybe sulcata]|uniref:Uncharacterized protein n=1 Tax=Heliocybe sulcata TaxID=5364 RepID=A0A5C3MYE6_9AGAM|nr:hypothetical protein OE88DRAFT_336131 [Heliocybe sulcata]